MRARPLRHLTTRALVRRRTKSEGARISITAQRGGSEPPRVYGNRQLDLRANVKCALAVEFQ